MPSPMCRRRIWRGEIMNAPITFAGLLPLLPEIVLGVGAMALLMIGVYRNERTVVFVDAACIAVLIVAGILVIVLPGDKQVILNGSFVIDTFARFLKVLALAGSA